MARPRRRRGWRAPPSARRWAAGPCARLGPLVAASAAAAAAADAAAAAAAAAAIAMPPPPPTQRLAPLSGSPGEGERPPPEPGARRETRFARGTAERTEPTKSGNSSSAGSGESLVDHALRGTCRTHGSRWGERGTGWHRGSAGVRGGGARHLCNAYITCATPECRDVCCVTASPPSITVVPGFDLSWTPNSSMHSCTSPTPSATAGRLHDKTKRSWPSAACAWGGGWHAAALPTSPQVRQAAMHALPHQSATESRPWRGRPGSHGSPDVQG